MLGLVHLSGAVAALSIGAMVIATSKGTPRHRALGWCYVASMLVVNVTALWLYRLTGGITPFHVAAVLSLVTILFGWLPVRRRPRPRHWVWRHATWMAGSYIGLCAAAVAETAARSQVWPFWWAVAAASACVIAGGTLVAARVIPRSIDGLRPRRP